MYTGPIRPYGVLNPVRTFQSAYFNFVQQAVQVATFTVDLDIQLRSQVRQNLALIIHGTVSGGTIVCLGPPTEEVVSGRYRYTWEDDAYPENSQTTKLTLNQVLTLLNNFRDPAATGPYKFGFVLLDKRQRCAGQIGSNPGHRTELADAGLPGVFTVFAQRPPRVTCTIAGVTSDGFTIRWDAVSLREGTPPVEVVNGYRIQISRLDAGQQEPTTITISERLTEMRVVTGLEANARYSVVVQARRGEVGSYAYGYGNQAIATTSEAPTEPEPEPTGQVPGAPNISITGVGADGWTFGASAGTGGTPTSYSVEWRLSGSSDEWSQFTITGSAGSHTVTGLTANTAYDWRANATNDQGTSANYTTGSQTTATETTPPGAPSTSTSGVNNDRFTVNWTPSTTGSAATSWEIDWRQGTSGAWTSITGINALNRSRIISGLTASTQYQYRVRGRNIAPNPGAWSTIRSVTTAAAPVEITPPNAPTADTENVGRTSVDVTWVPATTGSDADTWDIQYKVRTDTAWTQIDDRPGADRSHAITGLTEGTEYEVQVRGVNSAGDGAWSASANFTTTSLTVPGAPASVSTSDIAQTGFTVNWTTPTTGGDVATYEVEYRQGTSGAWTSEATGLSASTRSEGITGLTAATQYQVRVAGRNAAGLGAWRQASVTTAADTGNQPGLPGNFAAAWQSGGSGSTNNVNLTWNAPSTGASITGGGYEIEYKESSASTWIGWSTETATATNRSIPDLARASDWDFRIRAFTSDNVNGQWATALLSAEVGSAPAAPASSAVMISPSSFGGAGTINVRVDTPSAGPEITRVVFEWIATNAPIGLPWAQRVLFPQTVDQRVAPRSSRFSIAIDMAVRGSYDWRVRYENNNGPGPWLTGQGTIPDSPGGGVPSTPSNLRVLSGFITSDTIGLEFDRATGGAPVQSWETQGRTDGQTWAQAFSVSTPSREAVVIDGLRPATNYTFRIRGVNEVGYGGWSNEFSQETSAS